MLTITLLFKSSSVGDYGKSDEEAESVDKLGEHGEGRGEAKEQNWWKGNDERMRGVVSRMVMVASIYVSRRCAVVGIASR